MNKHLVILLLFVSCSFIVLGQHLNFKNITVADGLPQSQVYDMEQDRDGLLWIATQGGGVCVYDGKKFKVTDAKSGLPSSYVHSLCYYNNHMYIGTDKGLCKMQGDSVVQIPFPGIRKINVIESIRDTLFIGTQNGLFYIVDKEIKRYDRLPAKGKSINRIIATTNGMILSGIDETEELVASEAIEAIIRKQNLLVFDLIELEHVAYIGSYNKGLIRVKKDQETETIRSNIKVMDLFLDSDSNLWVGTQREGIFRMDLQGNNLENFKSTEGLANDHIRTIQQDCWGNIWIGTSGGGISRYSGSQFLHYNTASGLNGNYIYSVLNDSRNNLWIGTSGLGIYRRNDSLEINYSAKNGFSNVKVKSIYEDSRGLVWFGTEGEGFAIYFGGLGYDTLIHYKNQKTLQSKWVKSFSEDHRGHVWLATAGGGLYKSAVGIRDSIPYVGLSKIKIQNNAFSDRYNKIIHHRKKLVLATSDQGIGIMEDKLLDVYSLKNGLNSNNIRSVAYDEDERLWYISDQGLGYIVGKDSIVNFGLRDGLTSTNCYQLLVEGDGTIWIGTEKGIDRIFLVEADSISLTHYGINEGFKGVETTLNSCYKDHNGHLWFGSVNGLSKFAPREKLTNETPPILVLKDYRLFYQSIFNTLYGKGKSIQDTIVLPHGENSLSFEFSASFLSNPEAVNFDYTLRKNGVKQPQLTNLSAVQYSNLEPGFYELSVRAYRDEYYSAPIKIHFEITPPYWQTKWFLFSCIFGGIALIAIIIWVIYLRLQQKIAREKSKLEIERNLAELEQKALRLQMNPHFLFNILNSVQFLIQENDQQKARHALGKFAKLMRQILENSREKLISIDDELSTINNYIGLEKLTTQTDFDFEVIIDEETDTIEEILPPLMIQPFVENAIIHAFKGLTDRKAKITIYFRDKEDYLEIEVRDNGIGRKQAKLNRAQVETYHKSQALQVTQERLSNMNENKSFKGFEIVDHLEGNRAMGTSVFLRIQLN